MFMKILELSQLIFFLPFSNVKKGKASDGGDTFTLLCICSSVQASQSCRLFTPLQSLKMFCHLFSFEQMSISFRVLADKNQILCLVHFWPFTGCLEFLMVAAQGSQLAGLGLKQFHCWGYRGAQKFIICRAQQSLSSGIYFSGCL